ncbi:2,3-dihydro-2,3-dihydroxybenzoate dehydrogenase [Actinoplanes sp. NPDC048791]|uniref:2,3-dihydro-2,3-dihydroxybenzoate dehydrogenase n=1 Tax=Actinoplanes sp. NPDC048791 TaxID=3154623 RepID=UPI003411BDCD
MTQHLSTGLAGRVALVTGAANGIGAAVAAALAREGAIVAATDVDSDGLRDSVGKITAEGSAARAYRLDVTRPGEVEEVLDRVEEELGPVGVLANVAGVLRTGPVVDISDADWRAVFAVNVDGVFAVSRAVARRMAARRSGAMVTVTSNAAAVPRMHMAAYSASKAASTAFSKCLALEVAGHGVRCNVVAPGSTDTPMLRSMFTDDYGPRAVLEGAPEQYRVGIPLGKIASPDDVAAAVVFLASDLAGHITMQELVVDGGAALGG